MHRSRFLWKLYAGYAVLILVTTAFVGMLTGKRIEGDTRQDILHQLETKAILLRDVAEPAFGSSSAEWLQDRVVDLGRQLETRITVIRADGTVLADSAEEPTTLANHGDRPEVLAARRTGLGTSQRFSFSTRMDMMYVALPVTRQQDVVGYVRTSLPLTDVELRIRQLWSSLLLGAGIAVVTALIIGYLLARRTVEPLTAMTLMAESIAAGGTHRKIQLRRRDEIGQLTDAFNSMSEELRLRMNTIAQDRNKLRAILSSMVEGVIAVDGDERIVHINDVASQMLQVSTSDCVDKCIWEVTRVIDVSEALTRSMQTGEQASGEVLLHTRQGDQMLEYLISPLRVGDQGPGGAVVVLHDVTDLRRLESMRRDFVGNVSHELKTPLTAIRGIVETMIDDADMEPDTRNRFLHKMQAQTSRLTALVSDLLAISRLESQTDALARDPLDLGQLAREKLAVRTQLGIAEDRGLSLESELPDRSIDIVGDGEAISRIFDNLLDNALQYTPAGGRIILRLRVVDDEAVIEVEDTGIGIEPRHLERIFERFYRVDAARSREVGGTGLGLSIVKHAAHAHGGRVTVESLPGHGTTFRVWLPLAGLFTESS